MDAVIIRSVIDSLQKLFVELHPQIVRHWGDREVVTRKPDGSLVTLMDKTLEQRLRELFHEILPTACFLGEESFNSTPGAEPGMNEQELLIVTDPIDGTSNYARGNPAFGTLIGIFTRHGSEFSPSLGIVYKPILDPDAPDRTPGTLTYGSRSGITVRSLEFDTAGNTKHSESPLIPASPVQNSALRVVAQRRVRPLGSDIEIIPGDVSITDLMLPLIGEAAGAISRSRFWDIAGPVALAAAAGLKVYRVSNGEEITHFSIADFADQGARKWELSDDILITFPSCAARILSLPA